MVAELAAVAMRWSPIAARGLTPCEAPRLRSRAAARGTSCLNTSSTVARVAELAALVAALVAVVAALVAAPLAARPRRGGRRAGRGGARVAELTALVAKQVAVVAALVAAPLDLLAARLGRRRSASPPARAARHRPSARAKLPLRGTPAASPPAISDCVGVSRQS